MISIENRSKSEQYRLSVQSLPYLVEAMPKTTPKVKYDTVIVSPKFMRPWILLRYCHVILYRYWLVI